MACFVQNTALTGIPD